MMKGQTIDNLPSVTLGCDPEFFFSNENNDIIGAEKIIPEKLRATHREYSSEKDFDYGALVLDGVQVEINPKPSTCRETLSSNIGQSLLKLKEHLKTTPNIKASFNSVVEIKSEELASLSDKAKIFGCAPSISNYGKDNGISVNAATYLKRSAGGHIHLGLNHPQLHDKNVCAEIVKALDILVGNTCVMIDRDPEAATRRLHYGRAGEYRKPKHGLEYRTLSNFWMKSYPLMSFVFGLSRMAVSVVYQGNKNLKRPEMPPGYGYNAKDWDIRYPIEVYQNWDCMKELASRVDMKSIEQAINDNDLDLAKKNYYGGIRDFLAKFTNPEGGLTLNSRNLDNFDHFLEMVWKHDLNYWFKDDPFDHWVEKATKSMRGWERFLKEVVEVDKKKMESSAKAPETLDSVMNDMKRVYNRDDQGRFTSIHSVAEF